MVTINSNTFSCETITEQDLSKFYTRKEKIIDILKNKGYMLDWVDTDTTISKQELNEIKVLAKEIKENSDIFLVLGIGGSYLGAKALIDLYTPYFNSKKHKVVFGGFDLSEEYLEELCEYIKDKEVYVNVVSKSGSTLETKLAFDKILEIIKQKYPNNYSQRIIATTDKENGPLRELVIKEGFRSFTIPNNIGGRFSVFSAVGMLPAAVCDIDIDELLWGTEEGKKSINTAFEFASVRQLMFERGKRIEACTYYENKLESLILWYQQLFAETQGKKGKGLLPIPNHNTTNLHSIGQYLQDGPDTTFETVFDFDKGGLNNIVSTAVATAHKLDHTPSVILHIDGYGEKSIGKFMYFCFMSASFGAYLDNNFPFDQPSVETYKKCIKQQLNVNSKNCNV